MSRVTDRFPLDCSFTAEPESTLAALRAAASVHPVAGPFDGSCWIVTKSADVVSLLSDPRLVQNPETAAQWVIDGAAPVALDPLDRIVVRNVLYRDGLDHRRLRRLMSQAFTPAAVEGLRPAVERCVEDLLDALEASDPQGRDRPPAEPVDLVARYALPVASRTVAAVLGVPEPDRMTFSLWLDAINDVDDEDRWKAAARTGIKYFHGLAQQKRTRPSGDILSALVEAVDASEHMSASELASTCVLIAMAGRDTAAAFIANSVVALLSAPDQLALWRKDPGLLPVVIEELARFTSPVNIDIPRYVAEAVDVAGQVLPRGSTVLLSLLSANRDEDRYREPDALDFSRPDSSHVAFGHGAHGCIGAPLARLEAGIALDKLFDRFPDLALAVRRSVLTKRNSVVLNTVTRMPARLRP